MHIWGKILAGAAGFALGGPLGALIGVVAGHAVDEWTDGMAAPPLGPDGLPDHTRTAAFAAGVVVLGAKMAKADGVVSPAEIVAFKRAFPIPAEEMPAVDRLFAIATHDSAGFEPYARQLAAMFRDRPVVLEELLGGLFEIAAADGCLRPAELAFLGAVAALFGLPECAVERIRRIHGGKACGYDDPLDDPHAVLGVPRDADGAAIRAAWRDLVREHHPDRALALGLPAELVEIATARVAGINAAYDRLRAAPPPDRPAAAGAKHAPSPHTASCEACQP